jgi:hypothetical protein
VLFLASWKVLLMCKLEEDNCHVFNFFEFIVIKNFIFVYARAQVARLVVLSYFCRFLCECGIV